MMHPQQVPSPMKFNGQNAKAMAVLAMAIAMPAAASVNLAGLPVELSWTQSQTPFIPANYAGTFLLGNYNVGIGTEWSTVVDVFNYDDVDNPYVIGDITMRMDIGEDYIDYSFTIDVIDPTQTWAVNYMLPGPFYGFNLDWFGPTIASATASSYGELAASYIGDWNLWASSNPSLESWVDSYAMSPLASERVSFDADSTGLHWDLQGIAWGFDPNLGPQSAGIRLDLTFIPAPGVLALFMLGGVYGVRRRRG